MGRKKREFDLDDSMMLDLIDRGATTKDLANQEGCSYVTMTKKVKELQEKHGVLTQYRSVQALELTRIQSDILEAITPEKIEDAPLRDLVGAYKTLKERELVLDGKPTEITGLLGYLIMLEKEDAALKNPAEVVMEPITEAEFREIKNEEEEEEEDLPNL